MRRLFVIAALLTVAAVAGCRQTATEAPAWFDGDFEGALAAAQVRGTMLMLDFYSPN